METKQKTNSQEDVATLQDLLRGYLGKELAEDPAILDPDVNFVRYGLDSLKGTRVLAKLAKSLDRKLNPTLLWAYPSINLLTQYLIGGVPRGKPVGISTTGSAQEPIAVIGMGCRFPGGNHLRGFWQLLCEGRHAVGEVPADRWSLDRFYDPNPQRKGRMSTRFGGFLDQVDQFDPLFFGISPREASHMDPNQRIMMQVAWAAFADAGINPLDLKGSRTGVFCGVIWNDYAKILEGFPNAISLHTATGQANNLVPNRISFTYGLMGPSMALDTACSSSLVAIHLACNSLREGESELALAGGVNLMLCPSTMIGLSKFGGLSPGSRCKAFDAGADGFVRGEGAGAVVLKPLGRALVDGDPIYALIRGGAMNNDGATNGLTAPSPAAQSAVLSQAYLKAGVAAAEVAYVEAHGTGTSLGDPIEARALGEVLGGLNERSEPLRIGSVKTNIGHLEGAAGIAGFIKTVLALHHQQLPPSLHFENPNPHIDFEKQGLAVQTVLAPWPNTRPFAGVSSFGWGGTNCHLVLESFSAGTPWFLPLIGSSKKDLKDQTRALALAWKKLPPTQDQETWLTEALAEHKGSARVAIVAQNFEDLRERLLAWHKKNVPAGVFSGKKGKKSPKIAFVFSPQGGQWSSMGCKLMWTEPAFRLKIKAFDAHFRKCSGWSLVAMLGNQYLDYGSLRVDRIQPLILAIQLGLAATFEAWGFPPQGVVGHSLGEIAAAHVAGGLNLEHTAHLIYHYSRLQAQTDDEGTMAIVGLSADEVGRRLTVDENQIAIAAVNGPQTTVLSGLRAPMDQCLSELVAAGIFARKIEVNVAAHSPRIDAIVEPLQQVLAPLAPTPLHTPMYSTLSGDICEGKSLNSQYWPRNLREPMRFFQAITKMIEHGYDFFLEINPHPILKPSIEQAIQAKGAKASICGTMCRDVPGRYPLMEAVAQLYCAGSRVDWQAFGLGGGVSRQRRRPNSNPVSMQRSQLMVLSAQDGASLRIQAERLLAEDQTCLADRCYSAAMYSWHGDARLAVVARHHEELCEKLRLHLDGAFVPRLSQTTKRMVGKGKIAFVFPGQGSQWLGMGRDLYHAEPAFCKSMQRIDQVMQRMVDWPFLDTFLGREPGATLGRVDVIQPTLFAIQVSLAALWKIWGVEPDAVIGHSMGEVAAAHVAGALSLHDALHIICARSRLLLSTQGQGAMALVELTMAEATEAISDYRDRIALAVSNSPRSTVLSGDPQALHQVMANLEVRKIFCRLIKVDVASHGPQMDPLLPDLRELLQNLKPSQPQIPFYSTVLGERIIRTSFDAEYWVNNLRQPVLFSKTIGALVDDQHQWFVELSPHPILLPSVEQCLEHKGAQGEVFASMRREEDEYATLLEALGRFYTLGHSPCWEGLFWRGGRFLPTQMYPWREARYWYEDLSQQGAIWEGVPGQEHPLLEKNFRAASHPQENIWQIKDPLTKLGYLQDHRVLGSTLVPAAIYLEMALACFHQDHGSLPMSLENIAFQQAMVLNENAQPLLQLVHDQDKCTFGIFSRSEEPKDPGWLQHASGTVRQGNLECQSGFEKNAIMARCETVINAVGFYGELSEQGLHYGPAFQGIQSLRRGSGEALAEIDHSQLSGMDTYLFHPALMDACFQVLIACLPNKSEAGMLKTWLTVGINGFHLYAKPKMPLTVHARRKQGEDVCVVDVAVYSADETLVAVVAGIRLKAITPELPAKTGSTEAPSLFRDELALCGTQATRDHLLEDYLKNAVAQVVRLQANRVDISRPLKSLGLNSTMALELRNRLERDLAMKLSATLIWNYPTITALKPYLLKKMALDREHLSPSQSKHPQKPEKASAQPDHPQVPIPASTTGMEEELFEALNALEALLN